MEQDRDVPANELSGAAIAGRERARAQARIRQRRYRLQKRRIDFFPDAHAIKIIGRLRTPRVGGDTSSVINGIIRQWSAFKETRRNDDVGNTSGVKASPCPSDR